MIKPILTIGLPELDNENPEIADAFTPLKNDYYIILYPINRDEPEFKVFYEKDFNDVKYEELKQYIKDQLKAKR